MSTQKLPSFISGCNKVFKLQSEQPLVVLTRELRKCKTGALAQVDSHPTAVATCEACTVSVQPSYIELPPPGDVPRPEKPLGGREAILETVPTVQGASADTVEGYREFEAGISADASDAVKNSSLEGVDEASRGTPYEPVAKPAADAVPPEPEEIAVEIPPAVQEVERDQDDTYEPIVSEDDIRSEIPVPAPALPPKYRGMAANPPPKLPEELQVQIKKGKRPSIDRLLLEVQGLESGPSVHGMSRLKSAWCCLRKYFLETVCALTARREPDIQLMVGGIPLVDEAAQKPDRLSPLWVGSLCHAVRAFHLQTGGHFTWDPLYAIRGLYPEYALEVYRLMTNYYDRWAEYDSRTWDSRAVEVEGRYYFPSRRIGGRGRRLCLSSRYDAIYRPISADEPRTPLGEPTPGVRINELKTAARTTATYGKGYRINPQIQLQTATFTKGNLVARGGTVLPQSPADVFGPLLDVELDWIIKVKNVDPVQHLVRKQFTIPTEQTEHFLKTTGDFYIEQIGKRLWHKNWDHPDTWPQSWLCHDLWYQGWVCPFAQLCESPSRMAAVDKAFETNELGPLDRDAIVMPKKLGRKKRARKRKATATSVDGK